jgi:hypothetical protein
MDQRRLNKVVKDVKKILVLAQSTHNHLEKNKISEARRELKRIISFDADEITKLYDEDEGMAHQLLYECGIVLKDAKQALRELDSSTLLGKVEKLIDEIVKLEGHELIELKKKEEEENYAFKEWIYLLEHFKLYHGTNNIRLKSIQQKGLDPEERERFYTEWNLKRLLELISKAEELEDPISRSVFTLLTRDNKVKCQIHLVFEKERAISYTKMGVETFYQVKSTMKKVFKSNRLTAREKYEAQKIARPFIDELKQSKPVVLHISLRAPALNLPWLQSFKEYKKFISKECKGERPWFNPVSLKIHPIGRLLSEVVIYDKIPYKFIKVEYI